MRYNTTRYCHIKIRNWTSSGNDTEMLRNVMEKFGRFAVKCHGNVGKFPRNVQDVSGDKYKTTYMNSKQRYVFIIFYHFCIFHNISAILGWVRRPYTHIEVVVAFLVVVFFSNVRSYLVTTEVLRGATSWNFILQASRSFLTNKSSHHRQTNTLGG